MTRARAAGTSKAGTHTSAGDTLTCPECGKAFARAASLGAHRNRAHGVAGASARRTSRRTSGGAREVSRDELLQVLFPNGIPPREEVIRRAHAWLEEAESLARAR
jgi:uncharacterized C2H2 Zn-finger protein